MPQVLIIEDNVPVREFLHSTLAQSGYDVRSVPDGTSGITAAREATPDAVVLDLKLPGVAGREVLRTLKEMAPSLPVFLFTAHGDFRDKLGDTALADGCFVKSGDLSPLLRAIERAVGKGGDGYPQAAPEAQANDPIGASPTPAPATAPGDRSRTEAAGEPEPPADLDARLRGDRTFLRTLTEAFLDDYPEKLARLESAASAGTTSEVEALAHALRGVLLIFRANRSAVTAGRLERYAREGRANDAAELLKELKLEVRQLARFLAETSGLERYIP